MTRAVFDESRLPPHLRMTFRVTDGDRELAKGKDLDSLREQLRPRLQAKLTAAAGDLTRTGLKDWTIGTLPRLSPATKSRPTRRSRTPAARWTCACSRPRPSGAAMAAGTRRLLLLQVPSGVRSIADRLPTQRKLAMSVSPYPSIGALLDDCVAAAADQVIADAGGPPWDADGFARLVAEARSALPLATGRCVDAAGAILEAAHDAERRLRATPSPPLAAAFDDARASSPG